MVSAFVSEEKTTSDLYSLTEVEAEESQADFSEKV